MLSLTIKTLDKRTHFIDVSEFDHVYSILENLNIAIPQNTSPTFISNGNILANFMSFKSQNIQNFDIILIVFRKYLKASKRISFFEHMKRAFEADNYRYENSLIEEEFRLADLSFLQVESSPEYTRIITDIKCCYKSRNHHKKLRERHEPLILTNDSTISDDPLPICWGYPVKVHPDLNTQDQ
ncbi:hypothetical protein TRFO_13299 [Tritrichomonas foetus]|uniref:Uncharacterized protein n=1 Tax=Tritrichomonas foetus TaxID=1144522 RepID=A0A1J4KYG1_9EUKA|nr:hypothetical protein TRFO_13299 [Tritrichomonas foetus]|eukprot:OHT16291.1 hypothetical protein TRFO_13299 [Tritrichomonas foetus]